MECYLGTSSLSIVDRLVRSTLLTGLVCSVARKQDTEELLAASIGVFQQRFLGKVTHQPSDSPAASSLHLESSVLPAGMDILLVDTALFSACLAFLCALLSPFCIFQQCGELTNAQCGHKQIRQIAPCSLFLPCCSRQASKRTSSRARLRTDLEAINW